MINFIILAFIIFLMVKFINNLRKPEAAPAPAAPPEDVLLLREIRDELKKLPRVCRLAESTVCSQAFSRTSLHARAGLVCPDSQHFFVRPAAFLFR